MLLAVACLLIALRFPIFEAFSHLPVASMVNNTRLKWFAALLAAVLAGYGVDALRAQVADQSSPNSDLFRIVRAIMAGTVAIALVILLYRWIPQRDVDPASFLYHLSHVLFAPQQLNTWISVAAAVAALTLFFGLRRGLLPARMLVISLLGITFVELMVLGRGYNTTMPEKLVLPPVPLTTFLQSQLLQTDEGKRAGEEPEPYRIMATDDLFWPNYGAAYGLSHVGGYDLPVYQRYADLFKAQGGRGYRQRWQPDWPLVDWMGIKYIVGRQPLDADKYKLVWSQDAEEPVMVHRNRNVLPRAYVVHEYIVQRENGRDPEAALALLTSGTFDFEKRVLLDEALQPAEAAAIEEAQLQAETQPGSSTSNVKFIAFENDHVTLSVESDAPGILVMSDILAPGWQATVNGVPTHLYRANHAFRAIVVQAGMQNIELTYRPLSFRIGSTLSIISLSLICLGFFFSVRVRQRNRPTNRLTQQQALP